MSAHFALGCKFLQAGDFGEAAKWYRKAANKGHALAQMNLGAMCLKGKGIKKNYAEAARWYRKAADQGCAESQYRLGYMYRTGQGVNQSFTEASGWLRKAADQGLAKAQLALGIMHFKEDKMEAVRWIRKAADQGFVNAQFSLGLIYQDGGEPQSDIATYWLRKAAVQGHVGAQFHLKVISKKQKALGPTCANCGAPEPPFKCKRCKTKDYCDVFCQKQHWKDGHKECCVALENRKPFAMGERPPGEVCAICLEVMATKVQLPCGHAYHEGCVSSLRKFGNACPVCRVCF